jgi:hypothetical protein
MEEAAELANYLPLSFKTPKEQEYIEFLWGAFETNYTHGKYLWSWGSDMTIDLLEPVALFEAIASVH